MSQVNAWVAAEKTVTGYLLEQGFNFFSTPIHGAEGGRFWMLQIGLKNGEALTLILATLNPFFCACACILPTDVTPGSHAMMLAELVQNVPLVRIVPNAQSDSSETRALWIRAEFPIGEPNDLSIGGESVRAGIETVVSAVHFIRGKFPNDYQIDPGTRTDVPLPVTGAGNVDPVGESTNAASAEH